MLKPSLFNRLVAKPQNSAPLRVRSPDELRKLSLPDLETLADEIRQTILSVSLKNGGHLGASLGAVELAMALHFVFDSPRDPIIWDVGHQAYAHKLLTGRWDNFQTLRTEGGVSGFLSREESEHDWFGAGHSSTALSAAMGIARARKLLDKVAHWTVAVVGDGGLTAGLAFEALNNLKEVETGPLLIVINDNQMSISQNSGALPSILASGQAANFFNQLGCDYWGPVDGHDLEGLVRILRELKAQPDSGRALVLHALTQKGKGYPPAEELPATYHGVSPVVEKLPGVEQKSPQKTYSDTLGDALIERAEKDQRLVAITAAMKEGTGLSSFSESYPDRFVDVGIAEAHAVTFAAGLAAGGARPVVCVYSTFLQRALDAIIHDVCLQKLPVVFAIDRGGVVGPDGPTHHGAFDLAYLWSIPNLRISAPSCLSDLRELLAQALASDSPWAIRYPRGGGPEKLSKELKEGIRWHTRAPAPNAIVIALGAAAKRAEQAVTNLGDDAKSVTLLSTVQVKPISLGLIKYLRENPSAKILSIEDGAVRGGFGEALIGELSGHSGNWELSGYGDHFLPHASVAFLEEREGLSVHGIEKRIRMLLEL